MKKILVCIFCLMSINCVLAEGRQVVRQNPYINNPYYRQRNYYEADVLPRDLSALEKYSINKVYSRENPLKRLERLEDLAFGTVQSGDIESRYKNVETAILSRPKNNFQQTPLGTLTNYFHGRTTGVTPSIYNNYGAFMPAYDNFIHSSSNGYGNNRINSYSNGIFGNGYDVFNNSMGNGSSVRILY